VHEHATNAANAEVNVDVAEPVATTETITVDEPVAVREPVNDDVAAVADLLQQPVVVLDGDTEVVDPN